MINGLPHKRYTHKTSSYRTSSYKTSSYQTPSYRTSRIQNVQDTKSAFTERPVTEFPEYKTSRTQNVQFFCKFLNLFKKTFLSELLSLHFYLKLNKCQFWIFLPWNNNISSPCLKFGFFLALLFPGGFS